MYSANNPVIRTDLGGHAWDTVLDVASIAVGVGEVIKKPRNPLAWLSLGADVVCAFVPFLTGGGAVVRGIAKADDVLDSANAIYKAADKSSDIRKATGSYMIKYSDNTVYVGKGGYKRAIKSSKNHKSRKRKIVSIKWEKAKNSRQAFIDEYIKMCKYGGPNNKKINNLKSLNRRWSPGRKYYYQKFKKYYKYNKKWLVISNFYFLFQKTGILALYEFSYRRRFCCI